MTEGEPLRPALGRVTGSRITMGQPMTIRQKCNAPAPLVLNGAAFVGCALEHGHAGQHRVVVLWGEA